VLNAVDHRGFIGNPKSIAAKLLCRNDPHYPLKQKNKLASQSTRLPRSESIVTRTIFPPSSMVWRFRASSLLNATCSEIPIMKETGVLCSIGMSESGGEQTIS
jgi:hypothetical protein